MLDLMCSYLTVLTAVTPPLLSNINSSVVATAAVTCTAHVVAVAVAVMVVVVVVAVITTVAVLTTVAMVLRSFHKGV
jgi:hypothetical protein